MTNDEILQAAKESELYLDGVNQSMPLYVMKTEDLQCFASIIEKHTIERCAQEIEWEDDVARPGSFYASEIRKLGEQ